MADFWQNYSPVRAFQAWSDAMLVSSRQHTKSEGCGSRPKRRDAALKWRCRSRCSHALISLISFASTLGISLRAGQRCLVTILVYSLSILVAVGSLGWLPPAYETSFWLWHRLLVVFGWEIFSQSNSQNAQNGRVYIVRGTTKSISLLSGWARSVSR